MFAMMGFKKRSSFALVGADAGGGRILPSGLRKPLRFFERLIEGNVDVPKYAGLIGAVMFLGVTGFYGMILGGHSPVVIKETTSRLGFAIGEIKISGHKETSEIDVLDRLGLDGATSLIGFDSEAARQRILELPWIATAQVTKLYPDGVSVRLTEKQPYAVWQNADMLTLIEESGKGIVSFSDEKYQDLPLLIGDHADVKARDIIAMMVKFPGLASRVKAYVHVGGRRWDLRLNDGVTIQLPQEDVDEALEAAVRLEKGQALLGRAIVAVDLRIDDRVVVRLTEDAQTMRDAGIKAHDAKAKKAEAHL